MKVIAVHAGTRSMDLLIRKLKDFWKETGADLSIEPVSLNDLDRKENGDYDMVLIAPQVAYQADLIEEKAKKPCIIINSTDYALGNSGNITWQIRNNVREIPTM